MKNLEIFWAEDELEERNTIREVFQELFSEISLSFFTNGGNLFSALEDAAFLDRLPDLVVIDLNMPVQDGRSVLRKINGHPEMTHLPVVVFSGGDNRLDLFYLSLFKAVRYNKPSCTRAYKEVVKNIVEKHLYYKIHAASKRHKE